MTVFNRIVPGKVDISGIRDNSIPEYDTSPPTTPLHLPVIHGIFPKGKLASKAGTQWVAPQDVKKIFGDIFDEKSPYYSPTSVLIQALALGRQNTIGIRRLSVNEVVSKASLSAFVQKVEVQAYERDANGRWKYNENGERIPIPGKTYPNGLNIEIKIDDAAAGKEPGALEVRTIAASGDTPETLVLPLFEGVAGVGDEYNKSGLNLGVRADALNWRSISEFVRSTGTFPYDLRQFTDGVDGTRVYSKTTLQQESAKFTLFPVSLNGVQYSLQTGFGSFTGRNKNAPGNPVPAPFNDLVVYQDNIDTLCQMMYVVEQPENDTLVEVGVPGEYYKQMNPFTCTNHNGAPYYAITTSGVIKWDLSGAIKSSGGISPFLDKDGKVPDYVTKPTVNDPFGLLTNTERPLTHLQAWEITNKLMVADLTSYVNGVEMKDTTRNRQSIFWDIGYSQEVKDIAEQFLGARKDILVVADACVWRPGEKNSLEEIYSRAAMITNRLRMTVESEKWGTPACRAAVNLIEAKVTDEPTGWYFSGNIDLAYAFALWAGNIDGLIVTPNAPDHADNRKLRLMHSPNIVFEEDEVAAENFSNGHISLKPWDWNVQTYRPGLPTIHPNPDSVLKDLANPFLCVAMEKISADQWRIVCGDRTITADNYASIMKDEIESACRNAVGGEVSNIVAETFYETGTLGSRAKLRVILHAWFNKAKYMMEFDLYAYNQQDLATTAA
ncbi:hypothetical protein [Pseudomonas phage IR-QUMS-PaBa1-GHS-2021]|uniref:hypothetical protein n=2 Tax=Pseudomonas aeruginosa TaxID=287 RepID=UPI001BD57019|nr:hypothetical protein [Pseudomonas aeruginosa]MBS9731044.1 hypothetical protein [Pseudomonas aeruginosa]MDH1421381.1 hypothetical protein [Pseudomonas aeruginosa]UZV40133.1 hypothetical protein [Pseudomonas phage IR-QUMS-PaBa1-GHS-2021]